MEQINKDYFRAKLVQTNIGWRPTEDTVPLIGGTSIKNLFIATELKEMVYIALLTRFNFRFNFKR